MKEIRSDEARRTFRDLLDDVEHHGEHVTILRYTTPAAVIVPVEWYERAVAMTKESTMSIWGTLTDYSTGTALRPATAAEWRMSANKLAEGDPANGAFDGADGLESHVTVYVEGGPDADVTASDIRDLRTEAGQAGDGEQVRLCDEALEDGNRHGPAWYACAMAILDNRVESLA